MVTTRRSDRRQPAVMPPLRILPWLLIALASCTEEGKNGDPGAGGATTTPTGSGGGGALPTTFGGDRPVELHVPATYDHALGAPLLLLLHGYGSSGVDHEAYWGVRPHAMDRGMLYAYPEGTVDSYDAQFWNATDVCCDDGSGVDDSAYLRGLIDEIRATYTVDPKRIYVIGHSNGHFMTYRMACDHADVIAAIAGLAGATYLDGSLCSPGQPMNVAHLHGTADDTVFYDGGFLDGFEYPGAVDTTAYWASEAGCVATLHPGETIDIDADVTGAETTIERYTDCVAGGSAELWTIENGLHIPTLGAEFVPQMLDFLMAHPKP